jgi:Leucine-rich repeat (LRR) protein
MDSYFYLFPSEINELILQYLRIVDLENFIHLFEYLIEGINWSNVYYLHFKYYKNNIVYEEYLRFLKIESLKIKFNLINSVDKIDISQELNLTSNQITSIPPEIGSLKNLQYLYSSYNQITSIPKEIENLKNLRYINLSYNKITSIPPEMGNMENLQYLYLANNQIIFIPKELGNLEKLQYLYLDNNQITFVPKGLGKLKNLQHLYLSNNQIDLSIHEVKYLFSHELFIKL